MRATRLFALIHAALLVFCGSLPAQQQAAVAAGNRAFQVSPDPRLLPPGPVVVRERFPDTPLPRWSTGQDTLPGNYDLEGAILGGAIPLLIMLTSEGVDSYAGFLLIVPGIVIGGLVGSLIEKPYGSVDDGEAEPADSLAAWMPEVAARQYSGGT